MSRLNVTIDRVVLRGFETADRQPLVDGLKTVLARILADPVARAVWTQSRRTPVLRLGKMQVSRGPAGVRKLGGGIARAIGKGILR